MSAAPESRRWLAEDRRPDGVDDATVEALGTLSEGLEWVERARGRLYDFHQMSGHADLLFGHAVEELREAGHAGTADRIEDMLVGRNVIEGRWTFQIVEEYDATYWEVARQLEAQARNDLIEGHQHVYESEMKERRRTEGRRHHEARPDPGA